MDESNRQALMESRSDSAEESIECWRTFIENGADAFVAGEISGKIQFANDAACRLFGYDRATLLGMRVDDLLAYDEELRLARRRELLEKGCATNPAAHYITRTGAIRIASITTQLIREPNGTPVGFQAIARDVTEQQHALETLNQRNEELAALNAIAQILSNPLDLDTALDQVCAQIVSITGMESAAVFVTDESGQFLNLIAHRGVGDALFAQMRRLGLDDPLTRSLAEGGILALDDATAYPGDGLAAPRSAGYHAIIAIPILQRETAVGVVGVGSKLKMQYDQSDVELMRNIGRQIGTAMQNAELYTQMQKRAEELDGLAQLSAAFTASLDPVELGKLAVAWTTKLMPVDFANFRLREGNSLRLIASRSGTSLPFRDLIPIAEFLRPLFEKQTPVIVSDSEIDPVSEEYRANARTIGARSNCIIPLPARGQIVGTLSIGYVQPHVWQPRELDLIQTIANQVASAINNAQLFQNVSSEQRKVQAIFDSGLSGLFATDAEGRLVMFNHAAESITGWSSHQVLHHRWEEFFTDPTQDPPREPLIYEALYRKQTAFAQSGRRIRTRDGRNIPVAKAVAPLLDEQGNVTGAVGAFFDLSLEQAAELERAEFLKEVAHQLRSPLAAVLSAAQLLERPNLSEARRIEMWGVVKSDGGRLKRFADQFLDLEAVIKSQRPLNLEPLPIVAVARVLVRKFRANQSQHRYRVRASKRNLFALADLDRVENILRNLLDNAVNYAPPGTCITVTVKPSTDQFIQLSVQDHGPGVAHPDREKIFEPFYRSLHTEGRHIYGHGLGLAIAKRSVTEMGGTIWLDNHARQGATFHFTLRRH